MRTYIQSLAFTTILIAVPTFADSTGSKTTEPASPSNVTQDALGDYRNPSSMDLPPGAEAIPFPERADAGRNMREERLLGTEPVPGTHARDDERARDTARSPSESTDASGVDERPGSIGSGSASNAGGTAPSPGGGL